MWLVAPARQYPLISGELLQPKLGSAQRAAVFLLDTGENVIDIPRKLVILGSFKGQCIQLWPDFGSDLAADHQIRIQEHPKIGYENSKMLQISFSAVLFQSSGG